MARTAAFQIDAETTHDLAMAVFVKKFCDLYAIKAARHPFCKEEARTRGIRHSLSKSFPVLAAGSDKNAECLPAWQALGFGRAPRGRSAGRPPRPTGPGRAPARARSTPSVFVVPGMTVLTVTAVPLVRSARLRESDSCIALLPAVAGHLRQRRDRRLAGDEDDPPGPPLQHPLEVVAGEPRAAEHVDLEHLAATCRRGSSKNGA